MTDNSQLPSIILDLARGSLPGGSISPTDAARAVARALGQDDNPEAWHRYLSAVRRAAIRLAQDGQIEILRKGRKVAPEGVKGVIRLRAMEG